MKKLITALVATSLVLGAAVASASIPDSGGVIHGCYLTSGNPNVRGALRVIDTDAGESCGSGEAALIWSQTGPAGPAGPTGAAGEDGVSGYEVVSFSTQLILSDSNGWLATAVVACPTGKVALGGGGHGGTSGQVFINVSRPGVSDNRFWEVRFGQVPAGEPHTIEVTVYATCATV